MLQKVLKIANYAVAVLVSQSLATNVTSCKGAFHFYRTQIRK